MKILIIYGTTEGQTRKIARFMEDILQEAGHAVTIANATEEPPAPDNYDAVLVGSSIHIQQYHTAVVHYATQYAQVLNQKPSAFYSVCMAVASKLEDEHRAVEQIAQKFLETCGWKTENIFHIAGALKYTQYDFFKRLIMKMISKKEGGSTDTTHDHEYTDWEAVRGFVLAFAGKAVTAKKLE